jgi:acetyl-CoA carboxylase biotin carboxyl carrier protein
MKLSKIQELLRMVADSGVSEVEVEEDDFKITIRQNAPQVIMQPAYASGPAYPAPAYGMPPQGGAYGAPQGGAQMQQGPPASAPQAQPSTASAANAQATSDTAGDASAADADTTAGYTVKAPIVGTFYRAPSPDADPFVAVGDRVQEGDVLCIIEAMKLMNEIECETSGTIREILVENAEPVEFDQPLFIIDEA